MTHGVSTIRAYIQCQEKRAGLSVIIHVLIQHLITMCARDAAVTSRSQRAAPSSSANRITQQERLVFIPFTVFTSQLCALAAVLKVTKLTRLLFFVFFRSSRLMSFAQTSKTRLIRAIPPER